MSNLKVHLSTTAICGPGCAGVASDRRSPKRRVWGDGPELPDSPQPFLLAPDPSSGAGAGAGLSLGLGLGLGLDISQPVLRHKVWN